MFKRSESMDSAWIVLRQTFFSLIFMELDLRSDKIFVLKLLR